MSIALTPVQEQPITDSEDRRLQQVAEALAGGRNRLAAERERFADFRPERVPERARTLQVDDFSVIPHLQGILGRDYYSSRAYLRARPGDIVAATFPEVAGYHDYQEKRLGLGRPVYLRSEAGEGPGHAIFHALHHDEKVQDALIEATREAGGELWIHPYMGHEGPWRLAEILAERSGLSFKVLGPLPQATEWANNKLWFAEAVRRVLGPEAALECVPASTPRQAADALRKAARTSPRVSIKLSDCASGMGTGIFSSREILGQSPEELPEFVRQWMNEHEWAPDQPPLSVEPWETRTAGSPSIQLWIPPLGCGLPLMEGIFDQLFYPGQEHVFLGSIRSRLPDRLQEEVSAAGVRMGRLFQRLNYVGRCSFDTILAGESLDSCQVVFVECNGRWGGTSSPMSFMNRLFGDYRRQPYLARDFDDEKLKGVTFQRFAAEFDDILYDRRSQSGWAIVYNVGCLPPVGKLDIITLGRDIDQARSRQDEFQELVEERF